MQTGSDRIEYLRSLRRVRNLRARLLLAAVWAFVASTCWLSAYSWMLSDAGRQAYSAHWYRWHHELLLSAPVADGPWDNPSLSAPDATPPASPQRQLPWQEETALMDKKVVDSLYMPLDEVQSFYIHRYEHEDQVALLNTQIGELKARLARLEKRSDA
jgi:hypothetical protein